MEAYQVQTSDQRWYIVIANSWNEAARVAGSSENEAIEITRLTGPENNLPTLIYENVS
jgi:hypothetical protein